MSKNPPYREIRECRVCGNADLLPVLSLGDLYVSDFLSEEEKNEGVRAPLELVLCEEKRGGCGLLQLKHTVSNEALYRTYWYLSGTNRTMTNELHGIARRAEEMAPLKPGDIVMDIGVNDGTLLRGYAGGGIVKTGFEPAKNLEKHYEKGTDRIINDFFSAAAWKKEFGDKKAKIITAIAMFYDLDDPNAFVSGARECLDPEGVFIIQMSYLPLMLETNEVGNICHEHLEYYSLRSLERLLERHGLEVFDVETNDINGGSFRVYIRVRGEGKSIRRREGAEDRVLSMRKKEKDLGLDEKTIYREFAERVDELKEATSAFIRKEAESGKTIYAYGASTKGNTLLQYYGLDNACVKSAVERNPMKWGKMTVGTWIPIISEEEARRAMPDYFFILPWHFLKEFRERESEFLGRGGKFIVPMPEFQVIEK